MANAARIAAVISSVLAPRDGRPTLNLGPPGPLGPLGPFGPLGRPEPEPRSGIWKAKVRTSKIRGI
ncbi:hypothetical protein GCM10022227_30800 [Streptomyces sedi]